MSKGNKLKAKRQDIGIEKAFKDLYIQTREKPREKRGGKHDEDYRH